MKLNKPLPILLMNTALATGLFSVFAFQCHMFNPIGNFGVLGMVAYLWIAVYRFLTKARVKSWLGKIIILVITLPLVCLYFSFVVHCLGIAKKHLETRPIFRNHFIHHERVLLPIWYRPIPARDKSGRRAYVDYQDNIILLLPSNEAGCMSYGVSGNENSIFVRIDSSGEKSRELDLPRSENVAIVFHPEGDHGIFPLEPEQAKLFFETQQMEHPDDLVPAIADFLDQNNRKQYIQYISKQ